MLSAFWNEVLGLANQLGSAGGRRTLDEARMIGLQGCSSHSGGRTFITNAARKISTVGGSLRDVQVLAGHKALSTTQRYIEADAAAQRKVVDLI